MRTCGMLGVVAIALAQTGGVELTGNPPVAESFTVSVAPGETLALPFSDHVSDPDGDLFGIVLTSGLSDPSAGTLVSQCFCLRILGGGQICSCSATFTASQTFTGSVSLQFKAVDLTGLESAPATVTIVVTSTPDPGVILDGLRNLVIRASEGGGIRRGVSNALLSILDAVAGSLQRHRVEAALGEVEAVERLVGAQREKAIDATPADSLLSVLATLRSTIIRQETEPCHRAVEGTDTPANRLWIDGADQPFTGDPQRILAPADVTRFGFAHTREANSSQFLLLRFVNGSFDTMGNEETGELIRPLSLASVSLQGLVDHPDPEHCCHGYDGDARIRVAVALRLGNLSRERVPVVAFMQIGDPDVPGDRMAVSCVHTTDRCAEDGGEDLRIEHVFFLALKVVDSRIASGRTTSTVTGFLREQINGETVRDEDLSSAFVEFDPFVSPAPPPDDRFLRRTSFLVSTDGLRVRGGFTRGGGPISAEAHLGIDVQRLTIRDLDERDVEATLAPATEHR